MYDIVFISDTESEEFLAFKERFMLTKRASSITEASKKSFTPMFWLVWPGLNIDPNFNFDYVVPEYDRMYTHVFKNKEFYDGICLVPKKNKISEREFKHRFFISKKEIDIVASAPKPYNIFYISEYDEYLQAIEHSTTDMFWVVWPDVKVNLFFKFDYQVPAYDQNITHVFRNGGFYDGICLFPKNKLISKREFDYRFFTSKKEVDIVASTSCSYDIVFISYNEPNAEENYNRLLERFPAAKRVDKVKGIHQAHIEAAKLVSTKMFWVVDGDAIVVDTFNFDHQVATWDLDCVHVWRSQNPINGLEYGYGGVKLLPTKQTLNVDVTSTDMTTSISYKFKAMDAVSNITAFNTDPFTTWRSAFRECCKLAVINNEESNTRLNVWCTAGTDENAIKGALAGKLYGQENASNKEALSKINDFTWLQDRWSLEKSQQ